MISGTCEEYPEGRGHIGEEYIQYDRDHSRDRRDRNRRDYTPFHTQSDTEPEIEDKEHISSDTEVEIEGTTGDRRETHLARAQRDLLTAIQQMNLSEQMLQHSMSTIGANAAGGASGSGGHCGGGASGSSGSQGRVSGHPSPIRAYTSSGRIPRPLYPQF